MEINIQETHNFMNVESLSQLPFPRPSPLKEKSIRLFGKEFVSNTSTDSSTIIITDESVSTGTSVMVQEEPKETDQSNRKFECNYCHRKFPMSQALGGHQNAHKRERQQAKRAHLHSVMFNGSLAASQIDGLMNYQREIRPYYHHQQPVSWGTTSNIYGTTSISNNISRLYGGNTTFGSHQTNINGSALAMWRFPAARNSTFSKGFKASRIGTDNRSQIRYSYEQNSSDQNQVSLDLHL